MKVTDSGEGFDCRSLDMLMAKDKILSPSGHGLYFISSLMDEVSFSERGNQVTAIGRVRVLIFYQRGQALRTWCEYETHHLRQHGADILLSLVRPVPKSKESIYGRARCHKAV